MYSNLHENKNSSNDSESEEDKLSIEGEIEKERQIFLNRTSGVSLVGTYNLLRTENNLKNPDMWSVDMYTSFSFGKVNKVLFFTYLPIFLQRLHHSLIYLLHSFVFGVFRLNDCQFKIWFVLDWLLLRNVGDSLGLWSHFNKMIDWLPDKGIGEWLKGRIEVVWLCW